MERGLMMVLHAAIVSVLLYLLLVCLLKQDSAKSEDWSILVGAVILVYMILFGHGLPTVINPNILD